MCVIIYVPKESSISESEIRDAWDTNPHGAGYSIQKNNKVYFHRGFMKVEDYLEEILPLIGKYNLLLHFRISTSKAVNKVQTHPYKKGNVTLTQGETNRPVICMNGIISGQKVYENCNDTMSYIIDHEESFKVINQDLINIIEKASGAKWAVMTPENVYLSSKFTEEEGRFYSNKNHLIKINYLYNYNNYNSYNNYKKKKTKTLRNTFSKNLLRGLYKDKNLKEDVEDFIDIFCNNGDYCFFCTKCLENAKTLRDIKTTLSENYYLDDEYEEDNSTYNDNPVCYIDDVYDYDSENKSYYWR